MSETTPSIRPAAHTDFGAVAELMRGFMALHHHWQPDMFRPALLGFTAAIFQSWLQRPDDLYLVAERDGKIMGYACASRYGESGSDFTFPRRAVFISVIVVAPETRRRGVGRALFEAIEAWAVEYGAEYVGLYVSPFNELARTFYTGLGYNPAGEYRAKTLRKVPRIGGGVA